VRQKIAPGNTGPRDQSWVDHAASIEMNSNSVNAGENNCRKSLFDPTDKLQKSRHNPAKSSSLDERAATGGVAALLY
jgi:hypothetical protein